MKIGLDIMGGDHAPASTIKGAILAKREMPPDVELVLIGNRQAIEATCREENFDPDNFLVIGTTEVIGMSDHPVKAFSQKRDSSMGVGFQMLSEGKLDGFCSAGSTGAMLAGAMFTIKSIPGIIRPCIGVSIPKGENEYTLLLDVGLNPDARPDVMYQYAIMGSFYSEHVHGTANPKVGLLNIGEEEEKGNLLTKAAYQMMKDSTDFNFIGNVEGNEIFADKADVVVCEGFVGNVVLKLAESVFDLSQKLHITNPFFQQYNYENFGGIPIIGVGSPVLIGHGKSTPLAIKNMLIKNQELVQSGLIRKLKEAFE